MSPERNTFSLEQGFESEVFVCCVQSHSARSAGGRLQDQRAHTLTQRSWNVLTILSRLAWEPINEIQIMCNSPGNACPQLSQDMGVWYGMLDFSASP